MKKLVKWSSMALAVAITMASIPAAQACTGIYVGNQVSENGSAYIGRSEDIGDMYGKLFTVVPAKDWPEGAVYQDSYGFSMPQPSHTYAYTCVRDSYAYEEAMADKSGNSYGEPYAAAGSNECGVSVTATVSTAYNKQAAEADPLLETGICEISIPSVVLGSAATAREGVELLANIIDTYGAGECNALMIHDTNEVWYFEIVSGHQYAAVKMPSHQVGLNPNITLLGEVDVTDTENVIASPNLVNVAQEGGFLQLGAHGNIHVAKTYAAPTSGAGQYSRYYQGVYYVNPEAAAQLDVQNINNNVNPLPLLIDPSHKLSTLDVLHYLAYRGQGSAMDSNLNPKIYPIGNTRQSECHVFELRQNMPAQLATIQWLSMADAEFSVYVPFYGALLTDTSDLYQKEGKSFVEDSINWNFQRINFLCNQNRPKFGTNVKAYFEQYQESLIEQQKQVDKEMLQLLQQDETLASKKATALADSLAQQVYEMSSSVLAELEHYVEAGNYAQIFLPSAMTSHLMPQYSLDAVG